MPYTDLETPFSDLYLEEEEERNRRIKKLEDKIGSYQGQQSESPKGTNVDQTGGHTFGENVAEIPSAVVGGFTHAVENTAEALDEVWDFAREHWESLNNIGENVPLSKESDIRMPHPEAPETATGQITQSISQFLVGFIPAAKAVKAVGLTAKFGKTVSSMGAGAMVDYAAFDPTEGRVADAIQQLAPDVKMPVVSWLTSDEDDSAIEGRLKNVIEGAGLGVASDAFFSALKGIKGSIGRKPEGLIEEAVPTRAEVTPLGDAVEEAKTKLSDATNPDEAPIVAKPTDDQQAEMVLNMLDGKEAPEGSFGMINMNKIEGPESIQQAVEAVAETSTELLTSAGRSTRKTWEADKAYFAELGMDKAQMSKLFKGTEDLSSRVTGMRMVHADVSQQVNDLAGLIHSGNATPKQMVEFERGLVVLADVQASVRGVQSEIARSLNAMKINVGGGMIDHNVLDTMINGRGGMKTIQKRAESLLRLQTKKQKADFLEKSIAAKTLDGVQYYWINSLLSSPTTWIVNAVSNAAVAGNSLMESTLAATKNAVTGGKGDIDFTSVKDQMVGMYSGIVESLRVAKGDEMGSMYRAFKDEVSTIDPTQTTKFDGDIGTGREYSNTPMGKAFKYISTAVGTPGRVLMATDELFKTVNYRGHLAMQASISGRKAGKSGAALKAHIAKFMEDPSVATHKEGLEFAKRNTFQNDLGTAGKSVQRVVNQIPALRFIMPFIRTPTNIIKYAGHHTPFINRLSSQMKEDIAAGGVRAELAQAKVATGSLMFATAGFMASQGLISGGAAEDYKNGRNDLIGRQAYSVKVGDKWYSFSRLDPFGLFFGLTADMAELAVNSPQEDWGEVAGGLILAFSNNLASKTYLKGLIDFSDAVLNSHGDSGKAEKWITSFTSSFIPNFMNQTNRIHVDDEIKQINEFADNFKRRVYGASGGVTAKRNPLTGEKLHYTQGLMGGYLQVFGKDINESMVEKEIYDSGSELKDLPEKASMHFGRRMGSTDLSAQERDRLAVLVTQEARIGGKTLYAYLEDLFQSSYYKSLPTGDTNEAGRRTKRGLIRKAQNDFQNAGNMLLFRENLDVQDRVKKDMEMRYQKNLLSMKGII